MKCSFILLFRGMISTFVFFLRQSRMTQRTAIYKACLCLLDPLLVIRFLGQKIYQIPKHLDQLQRIDRSDTWPHGDLAWQQALEVNSALKENSG